MKHLRYILACFIVLICTSCSYLSQFGTIPVASRHQYITDTLDRICIYHGVNVSNINKQPPFLPWQRHSDWDSLSAWGFNVVRYLMTWEAIEAEQGKWSAAYLQQVHNDVVYLNHIGVNVVVDVHQDLYSRKFTGDGFPEWAIRDNGIPFSGPTQPWNLAYADPAVMAAFNNFWHNDTLQMQYFRVIKLLVAMFDDDSNVVGIDVFNDPCTLR